MNNFLLGVSMPFGKWLPKASYIYSDGDQLAIRSRSQLVLITTCRSVPRSTRAYSFLDNDNSRFAGVGDGSNSGAYAAGNGYAAGVWQQGFNIGVQHKF